MLNRKSSYIFVHHWMSMSFINIFTVIKKIVTLISVTASKGADGKEAEKTGKFFYLYIFACSLLSLQNKILWACILHAAICATAQLIFLFGRKVEPDLLCSEPVCWADGLYFV